MKKLIFTTLLFACGGEDHDGLVECKNGDVSFWTTEEICSEPSPDAGVEKSHYSPFQGNMNDGYGKLVSGGRCFGPTWPSTCIVPITRDMRIFNGMPKSILDDWSYASYIVWGEHLYYAVDAAILRLCAVIHNQNGWTCSGIGDEFSANIKMKPNGSTKNGSMEGIDQGVYRSHPYGHVAYEAEWKGRISPAALQAQADVSANALYGRNATLPELKQLTENVAYHELLHAFGLDHREGNCYILNTFTCHNWITNDYGLIPVDLVRIKSFDPF